MNEYTDSELFDKKGVHWREDETDVLGVRYKSAFPGKVGQPYWPSKGDMRITTGKEVMEDGILGSLSTAKILAITNDGRTNFGDVLRAIGRLKPELQDPALDWLLGNIRHASAEVQAAAADLIRAGARLRYTPSTDGRPGRKAEEPPIDEREFDEIYDNYYRDGKYNTPFSCSLVGKRKNLAEAAYSDGRNWNDRRYDRRRDYVKQEAGGSDGNSFKRRLQERFGADKFL